MTARAVLLAAGALAAGCAFASHWRVGPFFEWRSRDAFWAFRPFYSRTPDRQDYAWPLGVNHRTAEDRAWWRALVAHGDYTPAAAGAERALANGASFNVFPLWTSGRARGSDETHWGAFPFYGTHPHVLFMDDVTYALWPAYLDYSVKGVRSHAILFPFVSWKDSPREAFGLWPLAGFARLRDSRHEYFLWPIGTHAEYFADRDTAGTGWSWMVWPLVGGVARERETQILVLPPFFSFAETDGRGGKGWRLRCPWPLVDVERSPRRRRTSFWPLYEREDPLGYGNGKPTDTIWRIGWKLAEWTDERFSLFPFWTREADYLRVWPFYSSSRDKEGVTRRRALELVPIRHSEGLERNWNPFWTVWSSVERPGGRTRHTLLWGLVTWHTGAAK